MRMYNLYRAADWKPQADTYRYCPHCGTALETRRFDRRERRVCPACDFIHFRNPAPAIALLIVADGKIVLGRGDHEPGRNQWALPSGYIEYEEDFLSTAIREAREETGLQVVLDGILKVESAFLPERHFFSAYILAHPIGGTLAAGDDLLAAEWFPLNALPDGMAFPNDAHLIGQLARGQAPILPVDQPEA